MRGNQTSPIPCNLPPSSPPRIINFAYHLFVTYLFGERSASFMSRSLLNNMTSFMRFMFVLFFLLRMNKYSSGEFDQIFAQSTITSTRISSDYLEQRMQNNINIQCICNISRIGLHTIVGARVAQG